MDYRQILKQRGAAGQQYAIIVGLIAVIAIVAITSVGASMKNLLSNVGNTMGTVTNSATGGSSAPVGDCAATRASCAAHYAAGCTTSGVYNVQPAATLVPTWCEMSLDGGGWTQAMTINANDGNQSYFGGTIWTGGSFGSDSARWNDYKNALATDLNAASVLIVVRRSAAAGGATGPDLKGWRSWNFSSSRSLQSIFNLTLGAYNANASGGCNSGYAGGGNLVTSGIKNSGQCASYNDPTDGLTEDTFTCYAANLYTNSYYGNCEQFGDAFRLSSWYRWANNSNVGLGLMMDGGSNYSADAGSHMSIDTYQNPQRYCSGGSTSCVNTFNNASTNIVPGNDHSTNQGTTGEGWRYEIYVK